MSSSQLDERDVDPKQPRRILSPMTVAHADLTHRLPEPEDVDPLLRLVLPEREHSGGSPDQLADMQLLGKLIDAPVLLGVRAPQKFMARLAVQSTEARATLDAFADIAMREESNNRAVVLRCWSSDLTVALVTLLDPEAEIRKPSSSQGARALYWRHHRDHQRQGQHHG